MNKQPFTPEEECVMNNLLEAHKGFVKLERMHPNEIQDWTNAFHQLQGLLMQRVTVRDYPDSFYKMPSTPNINP